VGERGDTSSPSEPPRASRGLIAALSALVLWSLLTDLNWLYVHPDLIPSYRRAASQVPARELGFATSRSGLEARYSFDCLRYAAAPRRVIRQRLRPRSEWIVSDGAGVLPGYQAVRRFEGGVQLLRRQ
jgi:hypothetical protein